MVEPKPGMDRTTKLRIAGGLVAAVLLVAGGTAFYLHQADPIRRAERLEAAGDLRGALVEWRNAVRAQPRSGDAHLRLGTAQLRTADAVAAEREFRVARSYGADRDDVLGRLGEALAAQGKFSALLNEIPAPSDQPPAAAGKLLLLRTIAQLAQGDVQAAELTLQAAEAQAPDQVERPLIAARVALAEGRLPDAEASVDLALRINPAQIDALQMRIQLLGARNDTAGALAAADRAVEAAPWSYTVRLDRAGQAMAAGLDLKARADVDFVLARFPRVAAGKFYDAMLLARAGRYADAATALDALRPVIEQFPRALYLQALIAANLGNMETALEAAIRYNRRLPADPDGIRLLARARLASAQPGPALPLLQRAVAAGQVDAETLDLLGEALRSAGNGSAALDAHRRAAALSPDDAGIATHLGTAQLEQGDTAGAIATLTRAMALAPASGAAEQALIEAELRAGDPAKAEARLAGLRARVGLTPATAVLEGTIRLARADYEGARAAFAAAVAAFPDSAVARVGLGKALVVLGRASEGEVRLREALAMRPADLPTLTAYLQYTMRDGSFPDSILALENAQRAAPANELITAMLSDTLVRAGRPERAVAMLRTRRGVAELGPILLGALARAEAASGRPAEASAAFRDQLRATPDDLEARRSQVELLLRGNDAAGARQSVQDALDRLPGTLTLLTALVEIERRIAGPDAAIALARRLRAMPQQMPNAGLLEGNLLLQARRFAEARDAYAAEFARAPSSPLAQRLALAQAALGDSTAPGLRAWLDAHPDDADAAQVLARLDVQSGRFDEAARNLDAVLRIRPDNAVALNNLAWIHGMRGDPRARALAQRAYLQDPGEHTADTLGWVLVRQGEPRAALPVLRHESIQRSTNPEFVYHLAVALNEAGLPAEAIPLLERLAARDVPFESQPEARRLLETLRGRR